MNIIQSAFKPQHRVKMIVAVVILAAIGFFAYKNLVPTEAKQSYQTAAAARGTLVVSISASGQVSSANNSPINTQASGVITKVYLHNGDPVVAGQKIVDLQLDTEGQKNRAAAYSSYVSAIN